jgi:Ca2+-binding EF-hand superfamily protein
MSCLKDKSLQYKTEIKNNFESFDPNNRGIIETQELNDFINSINSKKKNPFIYNSIKSLTALKKQENEEGISSEEYISFIDNKLNDDKSNEGLKNLFNVFCDGNTGNISWNTFPLIARELGNNEIADKLLKIIKQSKMYTKELNFKEFFELMNNENDDYSNYTFKNENSENSDININNLKINEYLDIDEKPTYRQRKQILQKLKENESSMTYSSKNSVQDNDEIVVEEKYYNNQKQEETSKDNDNEKTNKRYHRRYRSKKVKSHNNNNLNENLENGNNSHKSYTKYRKNHINY